MAINEKNITNHWREIFDPSGSNISQLNRCASKEIYEKN